MVLFRFGQRERFAAQWIALSALSYRYRVDMASRNLIEQAGKALAKGAGADSKVILFGSHARGEERPDSDVDFLVIEPEVANRLEEWSRLHRRLTTSCFRSTSSFSTSDWLSGDQRLPARSSTTLFAMAKSSPIPEQIETLRSV